MGIKFFDKDGKEILQVGQMTNDFVTVKLEDDERVIGFKSREVP
jgi:hypothetical protein